ncbi:hypothetical protein FVE85_7300 [Porphyridium purpureum]|uniref:Uncharacterized protein n=1 Tax=Porphyridium purpureum TaxID=35688 RepID=A0A5J4Z8R7_PORPP|nr:hypothetical protein FVE85_7300 [Porphyridium purpureum]|eukprot:POR2055..scf295_1
MHRMEIAPAFVAPNVSCVNAKRTHARCGTRNNCTVLLALGSGNGSGRWSQARVESAWQDVVDHVQDVCERVVVRVLPSGSSMKETVEKRRSDRRAVRIQLEKKRRKQADEAARIEEHEARRKAFNERRAGSDNGRSKETKKSFDSARESAKGKRQIRSSSPKQVRETAKIKSSTASKSKVQTTQLVNMDTVRRVYYRNESYIFSAIGLLIVFLGLRGLLTRKVQQRKLEASLNPNQKNVVGGAPLPSRRMKSTKPSIRSMAESVERVVNRAQDGSISGLDVHTFLELARSAASTNADCSVGDVQEAFLDVAYQYSEATNMLLRSSADSTTRASERVLGGVLLNLANVLLEARGALAVRDDLSRRIHTLLRFDPREETLADSYARSLLRESLDNATLNEKVTILPAGRQFVLGEWPGVATQRMRTQAALRKLRLACKSLSSLSTQSINTVASLEVRRVVDTAVTNMAKFAREARLTLSMLEGSALCMLIFDFHDHFWELDAAVSRNALMFESLPALQARLESVQQYIQGLGRQIGYDSRNLFRAFAQRCMNDYVFGSVSDPCVRAELMCMPGIMRRVVALPTTTAVEICSECWTGFVQDLATEYRMHVSESTAARQIVNELAIMLELDEQRLVALKENVFREYVTSALRSAPGAGPGSKALEADAFRDMLGLSRDAGAAATESLVSKDLRVKFVNYLEARPNGLVSADVDALLDMFDAYQMGVDSGAAVLQSVLQERVNAYIERAARSFSMKDYRGAGASMSAALRVVSEYAQPIADGIAAKYPLATEFSSTDAVRVDSRRFSNALLTQLASLAEPLNFSAQDRSRLVRLFSLE